MASANTGLGNPEDLGWYIALLASFQVSRRDAQHIEDANREFRFDPEQYYKSDAHDTNDTAHYWAGRNDPEELSGPYFGLPWKHALKNERSFVLGSLDRELGDKSKCACDFQLADSNANGSRGAELN
ncbi:hypothetical protein M406DRAFT_75446 [Cryphonectria parasitica EP155]|uniref:Uncharacterized protein n=1 Tax=Cryphonectria parasitica (strain ATCC 38755 / EP155) TaxID=660469 RepID=A0A9P4XSR5_CRYP1|nr:uncharacterized protein M406DRAFT_75446 [Cryphonectria parasitica EP155]KAF3760091.1 hypothetical protein M406DRAFT_75446 [Cryphonectria parasitica EP155]